LKDILSQIRIVNHLVRIHTVVDVSLMRVICLPFLPFSVRFNIIATINLQNKFYLNLFVPGGQGGQGGQGSPGGPGGPGGQEV
jgi:hypothetical protein